jgi:hypothetical protein
VMVKRCAFTLRARVSGKCCSRRFRAGPGEHERYHDPHGILREVQPHALILAAGTRIALQPDLSAKDVPVGSSVLVTVTRSERGDRTARRIEHEPRRNGRGR